MKEELGLDHFEGRSWRGLHRHALMTMIAYAFLQHQRLKQATREKKNPSRAAATDPAGGSTRRHQGAIAKANLRTMSALPNAHQASSEPIQELVESDESFVIPLRLVDSQGVRNVEA